MRQQSLFDYTAPVVALIADEEDLLYIPPFLRRDTTNIKPVVHKEKKREWFMPDLLKYKQDREDRIKKKEAIAAKKAEIAKRRDDKKAARVLVLKKIESGFDTFGKLNKEIGMDAPLIKSAIRFLLKKGAIRKASARRYTAK